MRITKAQIETLRTTLEGCAEELEELMRELEFYVTELPDRIEGCLMILDNVESGA